MGALPYDAAAAVKLLKRADPVLGKLIDRAGPFTLTLRSFPSPFESLVTSITHQQLNGRAAETILGRVKAAFPGRRFPRPQDILAADDALLRGAGLSGSKTVAVKDLAAKVLDGTVPTAAALRRMEEEEIIERVTRVRGIGRWTVEMMLMFRLGRPDVLPVDDYGVRKGFTQTYRKRKMVTPKELEKFGERWKPFRSVASWYFWRALEL